MLIKWQNGESLYVSYIEVNDIFYIKVTWFIFTGYQINV